MFHPMKLMVPLFIAAVLFFQLASSTIVFQAKLSRAPPVAPHSNDPTPSTNLDFYFIETSIKPPEPNLFTDLPVHIKKFQELFTFEWPKGQPGLTYAYNWKSNYLQVSLDSPNFLESQNLKICVKQQPISAKTLTLMNFDDTQCQTITLFIYPTLTKAQNEKFSA